MNELTKILKTLSVELTNEFGKGFSITNLKNFRKFFLLFSEGEKGQALTDLFGAGISQALPDLSTDYKLALLSWTHYERLIRIENREERYWYMKEAANQSWSYRTLDRNISTLYYRRLLSSQNKEPVIQEMQDKTKDFQQDKLEFIKNPIFTSKYLSCLPTEEELAAEIERQKLIYQQSIRHE
ncbi:MAG: DUF1016 N-terminal domain-containing protein [Tannerella sp.]|jgi:hypothetical protein|nr:DUF1016 N-terminal domain-containing protein [Tannerella sp.]